MSKLVMVCVRDGHDIRPKLDAFLESLCPDNLSPEHMVTDDGRGLYLGVFRPHRPVTDQSAYVGWLREESNGSYAAFEGGETIEPTPTQSHRGPFGLPTRRNSSSPPLRCEPFRIFSARSS